jgi:CBS-domain-containing membrane protein
MAKRIRHHRIREFMTSPRITVGPKTGVRKLKLLFDEHDFNALPVVDEHRVLRGVVTTLDIRRMFRSPRRRWIPDLRAQHAEDVMSRGLVTVRPDDPVVSAVDLMVEYKLRSLPVVDGRPGRARRAGIVSWTDVLRCLVLEDHDDND